MASINLGDTSSPEASATTVASSFGWQKPGTSLQAAVMVNLPLLPGLKPNKQETWLKISLAALTQQTGMCA